MMAQAPIQFDRASGALEGANLWERTAALALMRFLPPREYEYVFGRYPHQLSGGMQQQRVVMRLRW